MVICTSAQLLISLILSAASLCAGEKDIKTHKHALQTVTPFKAVSDLRYSYNQAENLAATALGYAFHTVGWPIPTPPDATLAALQQHTQLPGYPCALIRSYHDHYREVTLWERFQYSLTYAGTQLKRAYLLPLIRAQQRDICTAHRIGIIQGVSTTDWGYHYPWLQQACPLIAETWVLLRSLDRSILTEKFTSSPATCSQDDFSVPQYIHLRHNEASNISTYLEEHSPAPLLIFTYTNEERVAHIPRTHSARGVHYSLCAALLQQRDEETPTQYRFVTPRAYSDIFNSWRIGSAGTLETTTPVIYSQAGEDSGAYSFKQGGKVFDVHILMYQQDLHATRATVHLPGLPE